jgi:RHS repeat-associated protein
MQGFIRFQLTSRVVLALRLALAGLCLALPMGGSAAPPPFPSASDPWGVSLLTEAGRLAREIPASDVAHWKRQLRAGTLSAKRLARLHLWLGEIEIARNKEPERALEQFRLAQRLARRSDPIYGCAAYDRALTLYFHGAYAVAVPAFRELLAAKSALNGYNPQICALWVRHAAACAGYHEQHAKLGITEPPSLDPFCGVASLAACLQARGRPYDRKTLLANCRVTGLGSNMRDLLDGAKRMGMAAAAVNADEEGLKLLPKPLVAYVEQDHFVALTRADKDGVSYLCSDCGAWPGGRRDLTWKQWRAMDCSHYLVVVKRGSRDADMLDALRKQAAASRSVSGSHAALAAYHRPFPLLPNHWLTRVTGAHIVLYDPTVGDACSPPTDPHLCGPNVPTDCGGNAPNASATSGGPLSGDPVNLAAGEEEYAPAPDLTVYNPIGPSVVWSRQYASLRGVYQVPSGLYFYPQLAFGLGWNTGYDLQVVVNGSQVQLFEPNGASFLFTAPSVPTASNPQVSCPATLDGVPMLCTWNYNADGSLSFVFLQADRSQRVFSSLNGYALTRQVDRNGNYINFLYTTPGSSPGYELSSITDSNNQPLLTIRHNASFNITAVSDRYDRSVYYKVSRIRGISFVGHSQFHGLETELTQVSQVVRTGTQFAPPHTLYGYQGITNGVEHLLYPALNSITTPSPTGSGASTAKIHYNGFYVASITDANRNTTTYTPVDGTDTTVTVTDPAGNVVYSYTVNFDPQMRVLMSTNHYQYYYGRRVYCTECHAWQPPIQVTDGNNNVTNYTYDEYGQLKTYTSPRNVTTTYTRDYSVFPLGELKQIQEGGKSPIWFTYYEPSGLIQSVTLPTPGTSGASGGVTTSFTYDSLGNILTITRPGNDTTATITTTLNYTQDGSYSQPAAIGQPLTVTDNLGHTTHYRYDAQGNRTVMIDAIGNRTDFRYNIANQQTKTIAPAIGDITNQIGVSRSQLTYVAASKTYNGTLTLTNTGSNAIQGYLLAALTNLAPGVTLTNAGGTYVNSPALVSGQVSLAAGASTALNVSFSAPSANAIYYGVQTYLTDGNGNPLAQRSVTQNLYLYPSGPLQAVQTYDEAGALFRQVNYGYGKEGELLSRTGSAEPVTYTYDAAYRLSTLADGNGNATKWAYNPAGYLASVTYPMGDGQQYPSYDPNGNILKRIDGRGIETDYTYNDPESKLTNVQYVNSAAYPNVSQYNVTIDYDGYGRTQDVYDNSGHTHLDYDDLNAQTEIDTTYNDASSQPLPTVALTYAFNPDGTRNAMNLETALTKYSFTYSYDVGGRPLSVTNPFGETTHSTYLNNDWLVSQQYANGVLAQYAYNRRGFVNDLTNYSPTGSPLSDFGAMVYDATGNRLTRVASVPGAPSGYSGQTAYTYDFKDQLIQEQSTLMGGYTENFSYDPAGNPLSFKGQSHGFNSDNQPTDSGFVYDGEGNPTTYAGTALAFDPEDHMISFGTALIAGYRANGLRAWKQTVNGRTYFIYDGTQLVYEMDGLGNVSAVNSFGAVGLISRHSSLGSAFYTFSPQDNTVQRLDAAGGLIATCAFDGFGTGVTTGSAPDPFGYVAQRGYFSDIETGLAQLVYRIYDPMGRFATRDPIRSNGGINLYSYVCNNPIHSTDLLGLVMDADEVGQQGIDQAACERLGPSKAIGKALPSLKACLDVTSITDLGLGSLMSLYQCYTGAGKALQVKMPQCPIPSPSPSPSPSPQVTVQ